MTRASYDWNYILAPYWKERILVRGKDFTCLPSSLATLMKEQAVKRRVSLDVRTRGDRVIYSTSRVVVEFLPYPK